MNADALNIPKISVIVPVWNPGPSISRCVESLRSQTLGDIELIFVDDRGTDGAMEVVRAAAAEDPRIRIITNVENMGPGVSRNAGIEAARGEYLSFVDADDYIDTDFLEVLYNKGKADDFDIVKGNLVCENEEGTIVSNSYNLFTTIQEGLKDGKPLFFLFYSDHPTAIFHKRLFANPDVRYGQTTNGEDSIFLLKACHVAKSLGLDGRVAYHYLCRMSSASNSFSEENLVARITALRVRAEYLSNHVEPNHYAIQSMIRSIKYYLSLQRHVAKLGMDKEAVRFLLGLREIAKKYPNIEKADNMSVFALVEYGVGLPDRPYFSPWNMPSTGDYFDVVNEWVDFVKGHPECANAAEEDLCRLYRKAEALCIKENSQLPRALVRDVKKICRINNTKQTIRSFIAKIPLAIPLYNAVKRWRNILVILRTKLN